MRSGCFSCTCRNSSAGYLLQLLDERLHWRVGFRRAGDVHVQLITVGQCIQAQDKCHIVMEKAGLWMENI